MESNDRTDVVVVGSGIAGLVAALTAADAGSQVVLLDSGAGRARTIERDRVLLNEGAHALYLDGVLMRSLRAWGVEPPGFRPGGDGYFAVDRGQVGVFPVSAASVARTPVLGLGGKLRFAKLLGGLAKIDWRQHRGQTVSEWLADQPADVTRVVATLVRTTTYTNAPDLLDAGATIRQLQLAVGGVRYVDGGWTAIAASLRDLLHARGGAVVYGTKADAVRTDGGGVVVRSGALSWHASAAVVAVGGPANIAGLLGIDLPPAWRMTPVEATNLDVWATTQPRHRSTFDIDQALFATTHAPGAVLAPDGITLMSVLHYLRPGTDPASPDTEQAAMRRLVELAGLDPATIVGQRYLHRMTVVHGFPTAERGGERPAVDSARLPGVFVAGDWVGEEGMLADAAAASGLVAARAAVGHGARSRVTA